MKYDGRPARALSVADDTALEVLVERLLAGPARFPSISAVAPPVTLPTPTFPTVPVVASVASFAAADSSAPMSSSASSPSGEPDPPNDWLTRAAEIEIEADPKSRGESATTRKALVNARLGQGGFRRDLLRIWGGRCAVTGCSEPAALIASHAKPWSTSSNAERLDAYNGLLLVASIDRLFDRGLVGFDDDGRLLCKPGLLDEDRAVLGIGSGARLRQVASAHRPYLAEHRTHFKF